MAEEQVKKPTHVQQALNELANGVRTGSDDAVTAARKRLDAAGEDGEAAVKAERKRHASETSQETKREAAADRRAAIQADVDKAKAEAEAKEQADKDAAEKAAQDALDKARSTPPKERSTKPHTTAGTGKQ